jgi:plasmid stability protein
MATLTVDLPDAMKQRLEALALKHGKPTDALVREFLGDRLQEEERAGTAGAVQSLLRLAEDVRNAIPPEELAQVPADACEDLDHYLYGTPRRRSGA